MNWTLVGDVVIAIAFYVLSIYTWPWIRTQVTSVEDEASRLRARIYKLTGR